MGLDISVYKVLSKSPNDKYKEKECDSTIYEIDPEELDLFKQYFPNYICSKQDKHWDVEKILNEKYHLLPNSYEIYGYEPVSNSCIVKVLLKEFPNEVKKYILEESDLTYYTQYYINVVEVGYQRKGANQLFYEENIWDSPPIFDLETLNYHYKRYFSHETPDSDGGWGSFTEIDISDDERSKNFYNNIVSKFVEGETFVIYY